MRKEPAANSIHIGQTVYLVASYVWVKEAIVRGCDYGLYTIQFTGSKGAIRIKGDRLYASKEEAERHLRKNQQQERIRPDYWHNVPHWMC